YSAKHSHYLHDALPIFGLISTLSVDPSFDQMSGRMQEGWASIAHLRELFDVRTLATDVSTIEDEIDVLILIHPKDLSPATLYARSEEHTSELQSRENLV